MLTEAQKAAYVAARGLCCPYCASDDLNPHMDLSADGPDVTQTVTCASCGEEWVDGFTLTGVTTEDDQGTPPQEGPPGHEADVAAFLAAARTFLAAAAKARSRAKGGRDAR
jgi:alkylhydroperoxidase family enzyme